MTTIQPPPTYSRPGPSARNIILVIVLCVLLFFGACALLIVVVLRKMQSTVPLTAGAGHPRIVALNDGWSRETLPELEITLEVPVPLALNNRTLQSIKYPWIESYDSYHGKKPGMSLILGTLGMDPSSPHYSARRLADSDLTELSKSSTLTVTSSEFGSTTISGKSMVTLITSYTKGQRLYRQSGLYWADHGRTGYLLFTYIDRDRAASDQVWTRLLGSLKL